MSMTVQFMTDNEVRQFQKRDALASDDGPPGLCILNCGAGDVEISFDDDDPKAIERAKEIVQDMLRRGYALFIRKGKQMIRVREFDPKHGVYYVMDDEPADAGELKAGPDHVAPVEAAAPETPKRRGRKGVPMNRARVFGVAPTSGG